MTSTRTVARAANGPYRRASKVVIAIKLPTVIEPLIARCPPIPYAKAVAIAATLIKAIKKNVLSMAIDIPISATLRARFLNMVDSSLRSP